jgi:hypothetical protein
MTTSESSCSELKKIKLSISSDKYKCFYVQDLRYHERLKNTVGSSMCVGSPDYSSSFLIDHTSWSCKEVYDMLLKVDSLLMESVRGFDYKLKTLFEPEADRGSRSRSIGKIHAYSKDLISWYDGKNWNKLTMD